MWKWLDRMFSRQPVYVVRPIPPSPRLLVAQSCFDGLLECLSVGVERRHEAVALLLGRWNGERAIALHAVRPQAHTTAGSFHIPAREMARVIALATRLDLQVVAQVHTHPVEAFHSEGDEEGANIRYDGFFSLVLPDYGTRLPSLAAIAMYVFSSDRGWVQLSDDDLSVIEPLTVL